MPFKTLQTKRHFVYNKTIIGIDPSKRKHQAALIDRRGIEMGNAFTFNVSHNGYTQDLWRKLKRLLPDISSEDCVFAIETACNLWPTIAFYLASQGYSVLLVSPLSTKHTRPAMNHDFSRTDPKDALIIANNARNGYFDYYREFAPQINAMHRLSITYHKLNRNLVQNRLRLRALMEQVFPEFLDILQPDTKTALYLLKKYLTPQEFINVNIFEETKTILKISHNNHGQDTLAELKEAASHSIGIVLKDDEVIAERLTLHSWITLIETIETQINTVMRQIIEYAQQTPYWDILISFKGNGISDKLAALFIAETRDLSQFSNHKKIEKYAGYNLRQSQSGNYVGPRRISHIGNKRLSWIIYKMAEETARYLPEVRMKYLRRCMNTRSKYRKNIIACSSVLLKLIVALVKENRPYQKRPEKIKELQQLEKKYQEYKESRNKKSKKAA